MCGFIIHFSRDNFIKPHSAIWILFRPAGDIIIVLEYIFCFIEFVFLLLFTYQTIIEDTPSAGCGTSPRCLESIFRTISSLPKCKSVTVINLFLKTIHITIYDSICIELKKRPSRQL